jgi:hypothetical protein
MEREHHRKRDDRKAGDAVEPERQQGGGGRGGAGRGREDEDDDAGDESGPEAEAAGVRPSREDIEDNIKDAWQAVKQNEASIVRGLYDRLKEDKDAGKKRSSGFFGSLFNDLTTAGVSHLLSKVHPSAAVATVLTAVFSAAKAGISEKLAAERGGSKILASEFLEAYVRDHITAGWLAGADRLESRMNKLGKKGLRSLRKHMRTLAHDSSREGAQITDKVLNAWMHALNQEHKRQDPSRDFETETSGRLHLAGVEIVPPTDLEPRKGFDERIHSLTAHLDGTGEIRNQLLKRRLDNTKVPVSVAGHISTFGDFSFGVGSDGVPKAGPMDPGMQLPLLRYGKGDDWTNGLKKLWNKMKVHQVGELVGNNKSGGQTDEIQGSNND